MFCLEGRVWIHLRNSGSPQIKLVTSWWFKKKKKEYSSYFQPAQSVCYIQNWRIKHTHARTHTRQISQHSVLEIVVICDSKLFACCFGTVGFDCFTICVFQKWDKKHTMNCFHRILTLSNGYVILHACDCDRVEWASCNFPLATVGSLHWE